MARSIQIPKTVSLPVTREGDAAIPQRFGKDLLAGKLRHRATVLHDAGVERISLVGGQTL